jgi:hypothetical protein
MAEPSTLARTFNQPRYIRNNEVSVVIKSHNTEVGFESREGIIRDFWLRCRDHTDQRALAGVWKPDQSNVSHQLELKLQPPLFTMLSLLSKCWSPAFVGEEPSISTSTSATGSSEPSITMTKQFSQDLTCVQIFHDSSLGYPHLDSGSALAVKVFALPVHTVCCPTVWMITKWK